MPEKPIVPKARAIDPLGSKPPLLGSWRNLYVLLVVELAALVAAFYALTRWAS